MPSIQKVMSANGTDPPSPATAWSTRRPDERLSCQVAESNSFLQRLTTRAVPGHLATTASPLTLSGTDSLPSESDVPCQTIEPSSDEATSSAPTHGDPSRSS